MDQLFRKSQQDFFSQFQQTSKGSTQGRAAQTTHKPEGQHMDIMDERDEQLHDYILAQVGKQPRLLTKQEQVQKSIPDIQPIAESFQCSICMGPVTEPTVIKHCLHFFCKNCVEKSIRQYKKECPLCKETMKTHRELRQYTKMQRILKLLMPMINAREEADEANIQSITTKIQQEQADMQKVREERQPALFASSKYASKAKGRKPKFSTEMEDALEIQAVERNTQEAQELDRIKRKVQKIRQIQERRLQKHKKLEDQTFRQANTDEHQVLTKQTSQVFRSVPEAHHHLNYAKIVQQHKQALESKSVPNEPLLRTDPPQLDLKVRILFEENLYTMIFPKVKELLFRVSRQSPLELAAKALARKNEHSHKWRDYSFTLMRAKDLLKETQYEDLSTTFDLLMKSQNQDANQLIQDELVLFYRVKDLQPYNFRVTAENSVLTQSSLNASQIAGQGQLLGGTQNSDEPSTINDESKTAQESSTSPSVVINKNHTTTSPSQQASGTVAGEGGGGGAHTRTLSASAAVMSID